MQDQLDCTHSTLAHQIFMSHELIIFLYIKLRILFHDLLWQTYRVFEFVLQPQLEDLVCLYTLMVLMDQVVLALLQFNMLVIAIIQGYHQLLSNMFLQIQHFIIHELNTDLIKIQTLDAVVEFYLQVMSMFLLQKRVFL